MEFTIGQGDKIPNQIKEINTDGNIEQDAKMLYNKHLELTNSLDLPTITKRELAQKSVLLEIEATLFTWYHIDTVYGEKGIYSGKSESTLALEKIKKFIEDLDLTVENNRFIEFGRPIIIGNRPIESCFLEKDKTTPVNSKSKLELWHYVQQIEQVFFTPSYVHGWLYHYNTCEENNDKAELERLNKNTLSTEFTVKFEVENPYVLNQFMHRWVSEKQSIAGLKAVELIITK